MANRGSISQSIQKLDITQAKGLNKLSIDFLEEGLTGIMGPNGCGKSTILHILACCFNPEGGRSDYRFPDFFIPVRFSKETQAFSWEGTGFTLHYKSNQDNKRLSISKNSQRWMRYEYRPMRWVTYLGIDSCVPDIEVEKKKSRITYDTISNLNDTISQKILDEAKYILNKSYSEYAFCERADRKRNIKVSVGNTTYTSLSMGAGEQRVFKILDSVEKASAYGLILIDEIDLLLHEDSLKKLIEKLKEKAAHKHLQIIFTAHNQSILSIQGIEFRHIYQTQQGSNCLSGRHPEALRKLTGILEKPINIFVEDLPSKAIIEQVCLDENCRKYVQVNTFGAAKNAFVLASGLFLQNGNDSELSNKLFVLDGDEYNTEEQKLKQLKAILTGTEEGRENHRSQVLSHIKQLCIPDGEPPESYYHSLLSDLCINDDCETGESVRTLLDEIRNQGICTDHHELFNTPIRVLDMNSETGYQHIAELLSKTDQWQEITQEVRIWLQEAKRRIEI